MKPKQKPPVITWVFTDHDDWPRARVNGQVVSEAEYKLAVIKNKAG